MLRGLILSPALHVKQDRLGRLGCGKRLFRISLPPGDLKARRTQLAAESSGQRGGRRCAVPKASASIFTRSVPADARRRLSVVGRPREKAGPYLAVMHSGVTLAPAIGRFVADELLTARAIRCSLPMSLTGWHGI